MKKYAQNTYKKYTHKIMLLSLAVSLSGCAGWGRWNAWNDNWNNITGGVRNYGQYPMPNEKPALSTKH